MLFRSHRFPPLSRVVWRTTPSALDFRSVDALIASLKLKPPRKSLELVRKAEDFDALIRLAARDEIRQRAVGREAVELLWEVCQIPDFRKLLLDGHVDLLAEIYKQLASPRGRIDPSWMAERIARIDATDGDIHVLMTRIAFVRTWTYVSNHRAWIVDAEDWQARTRALEDRLSDALHERLVARFVERESRRPPTRAQPGRRPEPKPRARREPSVDRQAVAEGPFAKLLELRVADEPTAARGHARDEAWVAEIVEAEHARFHLGERGVIELRPRADVEAEASEPLVLGHLVRGADLLRPEVALAVAEDLGAGARARIQRRLVAWARDLVGELLAPLRVDAVAKLSSDARGLVYQLERGLGTIHRSAAEAQLRRLVGRDRKLLHSLGVVIGAKLIWLPKLLRGDAPRVRAALCSAALPRGVRIDPPRPGAVALVPAPDVDPGAYTALGFPVFGPRGIRADIAERVHAGLAAVAEAGPFTADGPEVVPIAAQAGVRRDELPELIAAFGFVEGDDGRWQAGRRSGRLATR